MKNNSDLKFFLISLSLHLSIFLVMAVKVVLFPTERMDHVRAVRVDFVALPDIDPQLGPPGEEKPTPPKEVEKPKEQKTEVKKESQQEPKFEAKTADKVKKIPEKSDNKLQDQQNAALQRLSALSRIKKNKATDNNKPEGVIVKGNRINEGNALTGVEKIEYNRYLSDLDMHIKKNWHLPEWLTDKGLTAAIFLRFNEQGQILEKKLLRSSGNKAFDNEAMQAITNSVPFPTPPENLISYFQSQGIELRFPE